ncbi:MAG: (2Fe-2S)-binding protein [Thaumarchaeota archaeon]|nr:(2Fe-2S)-binding protein [Nitrososphaerota archaeon]
MGARNADSSAKGSRSKLITLKINGQKTTVTVPVRRTLVDLLRDNLRMTGTKRGCDEGTCGSCTVLLGSRPVYSCMLLAVNADGQDITTIEGVFQNQEALALGRAFASTYASQCGYCTPGFIMSAYALLRQNPDPSERDVRFALSGNLCRCTGYSKIVGAVLATAQGLKEGQSR